MKQLVMKDTKTIFHVSQHNQNIFISICQEIIVWIGGKVDILFHIGSRHDQGWCPGFHLSTGNLIPINSTLTLKATSVK
jgi:hypothetical protein